MKKVLAFFLVITAFLTGMLMNCAGATDSRVVSTASYDISSDDRLLVEQVVMAESGAEPYIGQIAVAQCILDAAVFEGVSPSEIIKKYSYTKIRKEPSRSVKAAVSAVFDYGTRACDGRILYFYAPAFGTSKWHEGQDFVAEIGNHRFFDCKR